MSWHNCLRRLFEKACKTRHQTRCSRQFALERLEDRCLLSVDVGLADGVLTIQGDDVAGDDIEVAYNKRGLLTVRDSSKLIARINLKRDPVDRIDFFGNGGDDRFDASAINIDVIAHGGTGNDILIGGAGNDTLNGGDGHDQLYGWSGSDNLYGGAGNDFLDALDGDFDWLWGGTGADTFRQDLYLDPYAPFFYFNYSSYWQNYDEPRDFNAAERDRYGSTPPDVPSEGFAPKATSDSYQVDQNGVLSVASPGVLANDSDADGDALTAVLVAGPANGSLSFNADGSFTYTPDTGFSGADSFTYKASDGVLESGETNVTIDVLGNQAPQADADSYEVQQDATLVVGSAAGLLSNDHDPEGDPIVVDSYSQPAHGVLSLSDDGSFTYTPDAGYVGADSFTYVVSDGQALSAETTVTIDVLPPPSGVTATLTDGVLTIEGHAEDPNDVQVFYDPADSSQLIVQSLRPGDPFVQRFAATRVSEVHFIGGNADDRFDASALQIVVVADGGAGADTLIGGSMNDSLYGGSGNDSLHGGAGNDSLYGGDDWDVLSGEAGNDSLDGGSGSDALYGGAGDDFLHGGLRYGSLDGDWDGLFGGTGADVFLSDWQWYYSLLLNVDRPQDFSAAEGDRMV